MIDYHLFDDRGVFTETVSLHRASPLPLRGTDSPPPEPGGVLVPVWGGQAWFLIDPSSLSMPLNPDPVPESVTPAQAKTALYNAGLYDRAEAAVGASQYALIRIWWNSAQEWKRSDPYIYAIAVELGLDDDAVDNLFRAAGRVAR